ncbi:MAG TPA: DUF4190 domain-containing protein [Solirubrobacter sp.]|nr:DUF4190 domain-containing protein [Solirubrobacter sp.]
MSGPPGDEQQGQPSWQQPESQPPQWQQPESQPQWGQQSQPQWGQQQQYQPQTTPGTATAALILGICAILVCPIICAPLALIYGNKARNEIDASGGRLGGRGMATAGIVLGWIGVAWAVLWVIYIIAVAASA